VLWKVKANKIILLFMLYLVHVDNTAKRWICLFFATAAVKLLWLISKACIVSMGNRAVFYIKEVI